MTTTRTAKATEATEATEATKTTKTTRATRTAKTAKPVAKKITVRAKRKRKTSTSKTSASNTNQIKDLNPTQSGSVLPRIGWHGTNPKGVDPATLLVPRAPLLCLLTGPTVVQNGATRLWGSSGIGKSRILFWLIGQYMNFLDVWVDALTAISPETSGSWARDIHIYVGLSELLGLNYLSYLPSMPTEIFRITSIADMVALVKMASENPPSIVFIDSFSMLEPYYLQTSKMEEMWQKPDCEVVEDDTSQVINIAGNFIPLSLKKFQWTNNYLKIPSGMAASAVAMAVTVPELSALTTRTGIIGVGHVSTAITPIAYKKAKGGLSLQHLVAPDLQVSRVRNHKGDLLMITTKKTGGPPRGINAHLFTGGLSFGILEAAGAASVRHKGKRGYIHFGDDIQPVEFNDEIVSLIDENIERQIAEHVYRHCADANFPPLLLKR